MSEINGCGQSRTQHGIHTAHADGCCYQPTWQSTPVTLQTSEIVKQHSIFLLSECGLITHS